MKQIRFIFLLGFWRSCLIVNMLIDIVLLTSNETLARNFYLNRNGLIPREFFDKARNQQPGIDFSFKNYPCKAGLTDFSSYLVEKCQNEGVILLIDDLTVLHSLSEVIRSSCFVYFFDGKNSTSKNNLSRMLTLAIKRYLAIYSYFSKRNDRAVLSLPFRNFKNQALECLYQNFINENTDLNKFFKNVNVLKKCRKPRRNTTYAQKLLFSDHLYFFEYANEKHARVATGEPHNNLCVLSGRFRFGCALDESQHYNMYKESGSGTRSAPSLKNCHNCDVTPVSKTHANVFPNDYVT